jgi:putative ABC transport system permease protein
MFRNYIKTAWRNIIRNKVHTIINVAGLALGLTCCLFIYLWVKDEKAVDNFHANQKNLYAVYTTVTANGKSDGSYATPLRQGNGNIGPDFLLEKSPDAVPEIKHFAFYATGYELPWGHPETFQVGDKIIKLVGSRAGSDFFKMFSYPLIEGNASGALSQLRGIAISRKMAEAFFKSPADAMGKTLHYENNFDVVVTAVFENLPEQSSLHFDFLFNMDALKKLLPLASPNIYAYVELNNNADPKKVAKEINAYLKPGFDKEGNTKTSIGLQPLGEQYLHNIFVNGEPDAGRIEYVRIFSFIALFILVIACINFMNLTTAKSVKRAKEIGLRKVVGSTRKSLILQFYCESLLFAFLAMILSVVLLFLLLPAFNSFTEKHIVLPAAEISFWGFLVWIVLITALLAGSYPSLYLSSLNPVRILKGKLQFTQGAVMFRKSLTVFQFVLSIVLIISSIVITRQISFIQNSHLGKGDGDLLYMRVEGELTHQSKYLLFKEEAQKMSSISMIDRSTETPHDMNFVAAYDAINWQGKTVNDRVGFLPSSVGFDFIKMMKLPVAEGRSFSKDIATDSTDAFMVNEEAVKEMGMHDPVGKWISAWDKKGHIIGVLKDYNTQSLRQKIKPVVIDIKEGEDFGVIMIRTRAGQTRQAIANLQTLYKSMNPKYAFAYQFVEEEYAKLYKTEMTISKLSSLFATLAIVISCLGLLGLSMFSAEQRIKEIGVRKVLGASVSQIVTMFYTEFAKFIVIAFLIAAPLAWYYMNSWLQGFAYKAPIEWWIFLVAGAAAVSIAILTVSFQSVKAALANPVTSLRAE